MSKSKAKPKTQGGKNRESRPDTSLERRQKIAEAAYYKAEQRGFAPGLEEGDWLDAEKEIDDEPRES